MNLPKQSCVAPYCPVFLYLRVKDPRIVGMTHILGMVEQPAESFEIGVLAEAVGEESGKKLRVALSGAK